MDKYDVKVVGKRADVTWVVEAETPLDALRVALLDALQDSVSYGETTALQRALKEHRAY